MQPPDRLTIAARIGCGAMRKDQACPVTCAERRADLVNAADYDRLVASAAACRARVRGPWPGCAAANMSEQALL